MTAGPAARLSYAEYLRLEAETGLRHNYWRGEVWPVGEAGPEQSRSMERGNPDHARIAAALIGELHVALKGGPAAATRLT